jgi:hypothetical protein
MTSRSVGWTVHVAYVGRGEEHAGFWMRNWKDRDCFEDAGLDRRTLLNVLREQDATA